MTPSEAKTELLAVREVLEVGLDCAEYMEQDICIGKHAGKKLANKQWIQNGIDRLDAVIKVMEAAEKPE